MRAIISVSDKTGAVEFATGLVKLGYEFSPPAASGKPWLKWGAGGERLENHRLPGDSGRGGEAPAPHGARWQPRPNPRQPGQYEMVLSASKLFNKGELVRVAESVPILPLPKEETTMDDTNTISDDSETISVGVNEEFTISLRVTPRLGERWEESHDENLLSLLESEIVMDNPQEPVSGAAEFRFKALQIGKTEITFTLGHGSTGSVKDQKVFKVAIK